ncbi:MAG: hypothetical protein UW09_C0003G0225 [candidate division TM6 bacterium GW2011_GWF2_43_87]|nr:MAG: hypothetical protein UW09_C0003G0225 [candidate division TM6 bacterium GW2011_GWF2_43_87]
MEGWLFTIALFESAKNECRVDREFYLFFLSSGFFCDKGSKRGSGGDDGRFWNLYFCRVYWS